MIVRSLALEGFRNYEALHVDFHPQVNLIYGDNAQGKTNLLEAIAYLSSARSHRARYDREMIGMDQTAADIRGSSRAGAAPSPWRPSWPGAAPESSSPTGSG